MENTKTLKQINHRKHYVANAELYKAKSRAWRLAHPKRTLEYSRQWRLKNKLKTTQYNQTYYQRNKLALDLKTLLWQLANPKKVITYARRTTKKNRATITARALQKRRQDPQVKLAHLFRERLRRVLLRSSTPKTLSVTHLLGCTLSEARRHIEIQFSPKMKWANHGPHTWHIDHIRPLASFDLTKPEEQSQAFHFTNLQPLPAQENLSKGARNYSMYD